MQLICSLEEPLNKRGLFDYTSLLNSTVGALKSVICDTLLGAGGASP